MSTVVGVYNAKGTLIGELAYITKKLLGVSKCALCDITHGWQIKGKASWKEQCRLSTLDFEFLHLEELNEEQKAIVHHFPAWLIYQDQKWVELMTADEIESFKNDPQGMIHVLENRVSQLKQS